VGWTSLILYYILRILVLCLSITQATRSDTEGGWARQLQNVLSNRQTSSYLDHRHLPPRFSLLLNSAHRFRPMHTAWRRWTESTTMLLSVCKLTHVFLQSGKVLLTLSFDQSRAAQGYCSGFIPGDGASFDLRYSWQPAEQRSTCIRPVSSSV
jgi:hypothetical protein